MKIVFYVINFSSVTVGPIIRLPGPRAQSPGLPPLTSGTPVYPLQAPVSNYKNSYNSDILELFMIIQCQDSTIQRKLKCKCV